MCYSFGRWVRPLILENIQIYNKLMSEIIIFQGMEKYYVFDLPMIVKK